MRKTALPSLLSLIIHALGFFIYLLLLYNGFWVALYLKACVYVFMASIWLFLIVDEWGGIDSYLQWQFNLINKITFIFNFTLAAFTVLSIFDGLIFMYLYAASVTITSIFILTSGLQHNYFKNES